jgi:hypothetical protein
LESAQLGGKQRTLGIARCFLAPEAQLGIHALDVQRFSIRDRAREKIVLDVMEPEVIFDRPQTAFARLRDAKSDEHLKILMMVRYCKMRNTHCESISSVFPPKIGHGST